MNTILWLEWRQFYLPADAPGFALLVRDDVVLDSNAAAKALGVTEGTALREAKTLCQGARITKWDPDDFAERQTHWLDICTAYTGQIEPIDQHVAALDLTGHPDPTDIAERLVRDLGRAVQKPLLNGMSHTKWIARLAAWFSDPLEGLPVEQLTPVEPAHRARLKFLGYSRIGDVLALPMEVLQTQFGEAALGIYQAARGGIHQPVRPLYPRNSICERLYFESPVDELEPVHTAIAELAGKIAARLDGRQGKNLELVVEREEGDPIAVGRHFTKPVFNTVTAKSAMRLLLPEATDKIAYTGLRVTLKDLEECPARQQNFIAGDSRPEALSALNSIQNTFGSQAVCLAGDVVAPRRERVLKAWRQAVGWQ